MVNQAYSGEMKKVELSSQLLKKQSKLGLNVDGPLSPDTAFVSKNLETYDAFVCMYHDQGLIPLKMLAFDSAVNVTLGLPIIRTSVDHGTALDIAWKGIAKVRV